MLGSLVRKMLISKIKTRLEISEKFESMEVTIKDGVISYKLDNGPWKIRKVDDDDKEDFLNEVGFNITSAYIYISKTVVQGHYINDTNEKTNFKF